MVKIFEFTGLRFLHNDMKDKKEERAAFTFKYNEKSFSCIFLTDIIPYRLYLTTLGANPEVFEIEINKDYKAKPVIENGDYRKLLDYLKLKYDPNNKFKPRTFFEVLNKKVPLKFSQKPKYSDVLKIVAKKRVVDEEHKIYFCGWMRNPPSRKVRNLEKTRSAFGDEIAEMSREKNISSCWTAAEKEETLKRLNELRTM